MDPFDMLPRECWEEVLAKTEDPKDKLSLVRSNSQLENSFWNCIPKWQLASILPIVLRYLHGPKGFSLPRFYIVADSEDAIADLDRWFMIANQNMPPEEANQEILDPAEEGPANEEAPDLDLDNEENEIQDPNELLERHTRSNEELFSGLRNCRAVNKLCCKAVDKYVEEHFEKFQKLPSFSKCKWRTQGNVTKFLEDSKDFQTFRNPSLSHVFGLCNDFEIIDETLEPHCTQMLNVIRRLGRNTKELALFVWFHVENPQRVCDFIRESLSSSPNLQSLFFSFSLRPVPQEEIPPAPQILQLPDLPKLESVTILEFSIRDIDTKPCIPPCVSFKKYFPQLKKLWLSFHLWHRDYNFSQNGQIQFPLLEILHLEEFDFLEDQETVFGILWNLNAPKMKTMELLGRCPGDLEEHLSAIYLVKQVGLCVLKECSGGVDYRAILRRKCDFGHFYFCYITERCCHIYFTTDVKSLGFPLKPDEIEG